MKNRLFIIAMLMICIAQFGKAQDVINYQNGGQMQAKILEISETEIKFKKFSNLEGPVYTIGKNTVTSILFENGETEVFENQTVVNDNSAIAVSGKKYFINGEPCCKQELLEFVKNNNELAYYKLDKGFYKNQCGTSDLGVGIALCCLSVPLYLMKGEKVLPTFIAPILDVAGTTFLIFGIVNKSIGKNWIQDACVIYNCDKKPVARLDYGFTGNGIGMTLSF